jgi:hypothetical protein
VININWSQGTPENITSVKHPEGPETIKRYSPDFNATEAHQELQENYVYTTPQPEKL